MNNNPYRVRGRGTRKMIGREQLFKKLCHLLTEHHVCVVGPPSFGKSVLLRHLASHFKDKSNYYVISLYWDLQDHDTPRTDEEFLQRFAERIKGALQPVQPDLAECLELEDESLPDVLHFVFGEMGNKKMEDRKICFLAVLDGFDHVLTESNITRNLWNEMYDLGQMTSLRLVTGSQRRLSELYTPEDSRRWNFSDIFYYTPLQVGCFEHHDWSGFLDPLKSHRGITCDNSALKEIANWTGGVPVLAVALAEQIFNKFRNVTISKSDVDGMVEKLDEELWELCKDLWKDCPIDLQFDLVELTHREVRFSELPKERRNDLKLRGFARESRRNQLQSSCLLMKQYAQQQEDKVETLHRLFGDAERFERHIPSLLEIRLKQIREIRGADRDLIDHVKIVIELLQQRGPIPSFGSVREIEDRALKLIWDAELEPNRSIPKTWKSDSLPDAWKLDTVVREVVRENQFPKKSQRGQQCRILRLMSENNISKVITKPTQLLVNHLHSVGNFVHHREGSTMSIPIAASFCLSAISLCESLAEDLVRAEDEEEG